MVSITTSQNSFYLYTASMYYGSYLFSNKLNKCLYFDFHLTKQKVWMLRQIAFTFYNKFLQENHRLSKWGGNIYENL